MARRRSRWTVAVVMMTVCTLLVLSACSSASDDPGEAGSLSVQVAPGEETTVDVTDRWSVSVPGYAVTTETTLSVTPAPGTLTRDGIDFIETADIALASG